MSSPLPYLIRMLLFLAGVAGLAFFLHEDLFRIFAHTPQLDAVILGVLVLGIFFVFRQVIILWPEVSWMRRYRRREEDSPVPPTESINLLAPLAAMLGEGHGRIRLSPTATRAVLDGIATRLDERREIARYMIGLLIFLGLLGTFWGLLQTIGSVADAINGLQVSAGDAVQMFAKLKTSIEGPLKGMSTAFGASLFGLSGSLVLGFLELQASQAQGRFHIELEEWLARATSLSTSSLPPGVAQSVPAYVEALLERNTEGVDGLIRAIHRIEESRQATAAGNATLVERLAALAESMRAQQNLLARFTELSIELRTALARLSERSTDDEAEREAAHAHRRAIEGHLARLVEESLRTRGTLADEIGKASDAHRGALEARIVELGTQAAAHRQQIAADLEQLYQDGASGRAQMSEELKYAVARLSDRSAADADREAMMNLQQTVEGQLAHVVDESARARVALAEELRGAVNQLADRFADVDRDAMALHRRNIEAHLARLVEDTASNRTALAEEIRSEIRLLARTIALSRQPEQEPAQEQPTGN
ncbi:MAG: hypothetical protein ACHQPH_22095 [Reyranellales bacterium]